MLKKKDWNDESMIKTAGDEFSFGLLNDYSANKANQVTWHQ